MDRPRTVHEPIDELSILYPSFRVPITDRKLFFHATPSLMMTHSPAWTGLSRRRLIGAVAASLAVGAAGCSSDDPSERADPQPPVAYASADTSVLVDVDVAVADSESTRRLLEAYGEDGDDGDAEGDFFETFEGRMGLDPSEANDALAFADQPRSERMTLVVDADLEEEAAVAAIEAVRDTEYEASEHDVGTVYRPVDAGDDDNGGGDDDNGDGDGNADDDLEPLALGVAAEGQFVVGSEGDVRAALDAFGDDADSLDDALREALEDGWETEFDGEHGSVDDDDRERYVVAVTDRAHEYLPDEDHEEVPAGAGFDLYEEVETATVTYAAGEDTVGVDVRLRAPDEDTAGQIEDRTAFIAEMLPGFVDDEAVAAELQQVEVAREDSDVTAAYRSDVDGAATLAGWIGARM